MGRGGGNSSRGRGKFKVSRGGGRHFSRDLDPRLALRNQPLGSSDDEEEEESSEEESDDEQPGQNLDAALAPAMAAVNLKLGNTEAIPQSGEAEMSRAERKALKKAQGESTGKKKVSIQEPEDDSDDEPAPAPAPVKPKAKPAVQEMTRREREAAEKKAAKERYDKRHAEGKTPEAQSDMARLLEVRRRREAAAAQREAEAAEAAKAANEKKEKLAARRL